MSAEEQTKTDEKAAPAPRAFTFGELESTTDVNPRPSAYCFGELGVPGFGAPFTELPTKLP